MQVDNVCSPGVPGFAELEISPRSVENILEQTLRSREGGLPEGQGQPAEWAARGSLIACIASLICGSASLGQQHSRPLEQ